MDDDSSIFFPPYHLTITFINMYKLFMDLTMWKTCVVFVKYNDSWTMISTWNGSCLSTIIEGNCSVPNDSINYQCPLFVLHLTITKCYANYFMISNHSWQFKWQTVIVGNISNHSNTNLSSEKRLNFWTQKWQRQKYRSWFRIGTQNGGSE